MEWTRPEMPRWLVGERGARDGTDRKARFGMPSRRGRRHPGGEEKGPRATSVWESEDGAGLEIEVWEPAVYKSYLKPLSWMRSPRE